MSNQRKFGTFGGVFVPSILTILGVIMYMRLPNIISESGLIGTIGIILVAHIISITTGLSVSSIATDRKVKAGGTYYMISRSLGLPIGGTLGLALFVGLSFSVSLYLIGFAESFLSYWDFEVTKNNIRIAGSAILLLVSTITFISTSLAIKTQYYILAAIVLSLASIFVGKHDYTPEVPLISNPDSTVPLMVLFGIFFPAVTGFEAGVSMSGDLKDSKKSIPVGTIAAIAVGLTVYIGLAFFFSYTVSPEALADSNVLLNIARVPELVIAGIWGATLSSALGSILGAPRILQATAVDGITPKIFSKGKGKSNEPRNALFLTFIIAEAGILIGELDVIARVVSIFFITTYGFLNLSCAFEKMTSADFRPSFKTPVWLSILGALACFIVMLELDFLATLGGTIIMVLVFLLLKRKELTLQGGDTWGGVWASLVKSGLEYLNTKAVPNRNWRPNILMFYIYPEAHEHLLKLAKGLRGKLGLLTTFDLKISEKLTSVEQEKSKEEEEEIEDDDLSYFALKYSVSDPYEGIDEISRVYGFSGVRPNTILMPWPKAEEQGIKFGQLVAGFKKSNLNAVFLSLNEERLFGDFEEIDIWWSGFGSNLSFAISIIRHLTSGKDWKTVKIRLFVPVNNRILTEKVYQTLERIIDQYRINIEIKIVNNAIEKLKDLELIRKESAHADLTVIGMPNKRYDQLEEFIAELNELTPHIGTSILINASRSFESYHLELSESPAVVVEEQSFELNPIRQFNYPSITSEINRMDNELQGLIQSFIERTFLPHFVEANDWIQNLKESVDSTINNFIKANEIGDKFRRNKAYFKIKNEFYFKVTSLFEKKQTYKFKELRHQLEKGFSWYINEMQTKVSSMPSKYRIEHSKESFKNLNGEAIRLKRYKLWKRITHPFAKKTIPIKVKYRKLGINYINYRQLIALNQTLTDFELWSYNFLNDLKARINSIDEMSDQVGHEFVEGKISKLQFEKSRTDQLMKLQKLEIKLKSEQARLSKELLTRGRNDLLQMGTEMEKIQVNKNLKLKRGLSQAATKATREIAVFPEQWHDKAVLYYNKLDSEVIMTSFKNRVLKLIDDYKSDINASFYQSLTRNIKKLKNKIEENAHALENVRQIKVDFSGEKSSRVFKDLDHLNLEVIKLADGLPKEMALPFEDVSNKGQVEPVIVPISKISRHFYESRFVGQVASRIDKTEEAVTRIVHETSDQMNLTRFSIDNLEDDAGLNGKNRDAIIKDVLDLLTEKEQEIAELYDALCQQFENAFEEAFEPLASFKIIESSKMFSSQIRTQQGLRIRNFFGLKSRSFNTSIVKQLARLWYSKSEGVLLAKRLMEAEKMKSNNEKILDIVESVTPSPKTLNSIPHYYKSLFSDRSIIAEELWVEMVREQAAFSKAIERYQTGIRGGILVTGERNSGKTNLCQYVIRKHFRHNQVYHVFPPVEGSVDLKTFERSLGKVTGISREKSEIYNTLQFGSVIVLHDLELWWQRSPNGLDLIKEIIKDINEYSSSYLFVMNMNVYAYELINNILHIDHNLIGVIECQPFDTEGLQSLIMKRHRSSGLSFTVEGREEKSLSHLKMARLFSKYFDHTKGNPGVALFSWLNSIDQYKDENLTMRYPENPDSEQIGKLEIQALSLLQQFVLHKRMDAEKISEVFNYSMDQTEEEVRPLTINGLLQEKSEGVYMINPYVEPIVVRVLKQKDLL